MGTFETNWRMRVRNFLLGRSVVKLVLDWAVLVVTVPAAFLIRLDAEDLLRFKSSILVFTLVAFIVPLPLLAFTRLYRRSWRRAHLQDVVILSKLVFLWMATMYTISYLLVQQYPLPRSVFLIAGMLNLLLLAGMRLVYRLVCDRGPPSMSAPRAEQKAVILGAGDAGVMILRELLRSQNHTIDVIGFLDDKLSIQGQLILGYPVFGGMTRSNFLKLKEEYGLTDAIIAMPSATGHAIRRMVDICHEAGIRSKLIPRLADVVTGRIGIQHLRDVQIEDLLRREPVSLDAARISATIREKVVLVTGAGGSIGSEIVRQICQYHPREVHIVGRGENSIYEIQKEIISSYPDVTLRSWIADVRDLDRVDHIFRQARPEVVFHAAAHKHLPFLEVHASEAVLNNIFGTWNICVSCEKYDVEKMVNISTDKAVNPTSVLGASKRIAEMIVTAYGRKLLDRGQTQVSVRFGNVLGSRGSVVPLFKEQIRKGGPITLTHPDITRYFMTIPEATQLVLQASAFNQSGTTYFLDMGDPVRIIDLANDLIRYSGLEPGRDIAVEITGLRPGEKLHEELSSKSDEVSKSEHEKIFVARIKDECSGEDLDQVLRALRELVKREDREGIFQIFRSLFATFGKTESSATVVTLGNKR